MPEETQECKDNVDECVDVTKPFCREVEITLRNSDSLMPKQLAKVIGASPLLQVVDHVCKEKLTFRLEQKCATRNVTQVREVRERKKGIFLVFLLGHSCVILDQQNML